MSLTAYLAGLALGLPLIVPIGAQNALVLKTGLNAPRIGLVITGATVIACDAFLMTIGALGVAGLVGENESLRIGLFVVGSVVLIQIGVSYVREGMAAAASPEGEDVETQVPRESQHLSLHTLKLWVLPALAVSLLNPHAIIDAVAVIGGAAATFSDEQRPYFLAGAITASALWFTGLLLFAAKGLRRLGPRVERVIDIGSGVVIIAVAVAFAAEALKLLL